jgi:hypothetical protein
MKFSKQTRLAILFISTLIVGACTADTSLRSRVESYLDENITDLSPRTPTQGDFRVTDVEWVDDTIIRVTYEDEAGVELKATASVNQDDPNLISNFRIDTNGSSSSIESSVSSAMTDSSMSSTSLSSTFSSASAMSAMSIPSPY